jgi:hypothetical protein
VRITRVHLEEDVGKNFHFDRNSGSTSTEPAFRSWKLSPNPISPAPTWPMNIFVRSRRS